MSVSKEIYIYHKNKYKKAIKRAKREYFTNKLNAVKDSKDFFNLTNYLLGKETVPVMPQSAQPEELVEEFTEFFINKIAQIRASLEEYDIELDENTFKGDEMASFREVTNDEIKSIIMSSNSKSCELDAMPTSLLKSTIEVTCPYITEIINMSLKSGIFPQTHKRALVRPLIKKPGLDQMT